MGFYIQVPKNLDKARQLIELHEAFIILSNPPDFDLVPEDKALICVVSNPLFDAAGYAYSKREFEEFSNPEDLRPKIWLYMDKQLVHELVGLKGDEPFLNNDGE